jgi:hypothetical protein
LLEATGGAFLVRQYITRNNTENQVNILLAVIYLSRYNPAHGKGKKDRLVLAMRALRA